MQQAIQKTEEYVRKTLESEGTGHDWWHIYRVHKAAVHIGQKEGADPAIVHLAALLHDIADFKTYDGDTTVGPKVAGDWLSQCGVDQTIIDHVKDIILNMSFKGAGVKSQVKTLEGKVVQDADRLDAIGAIGIARTFTYGGKNNRLIYDPEVKPVCHTSVQQFVDHKGTTINHFYEKLLLCKDLMNTPTAKKIAERRHSVIEQFLKQFYAEWEGKDYEPDQGSFLYL